MGVICHNIGFKSKSSFAPLQAILLLPLFVVLCAFGGDANEKLQHLGAITGPKPIVLFKNRDTGAIKAFRVGENAFGAGAVTAIDRDSATVLENDGQSTVVSSKMGGAFRLKKAPKVLVNTDEKYIEDGFARTGNKIEVDKNYKDRMIKEELPNILMQASSEPVMENGEIKGFRLFQFDQSSMFGKLGMKDGDMVKEINGTPLNNVAKTIQFLNGLKDESRVSVNIIRDGQPITLDLNVK